MPASSVMSVIAPVVGAASASLGTEGEDVSTQFAAVLSEADEALTVRPECTAPPPSAQPTPRIGTPKTAPTSALVLALEDGAADGALAETALATPPPVAEISRPEAPAPSGAKAEGEETDPAPDSPIIATPVVAAPTPAPPSVAVAPPSTAESAAAEDGMAGASPPPASDAPDTPAETTPASDAAAVQTAAAKTSETAPPPQPLKSEPSRNASVQRDGGASDASAEPTPSASETSKAGKAGTTAETSTGRAPDPTTPPPPSPLAKLPETASAPRLEPAAFNTPTGETPAHPTADAAPTAPAVAASTLSRATIETTVQIAAQIARRLEGKQTRFDMVLTPEDLGRVEVSLDIDADGRLAARLAFDNPAAAADLRGRADDLRRQLIDAGFQLAGDSLEFSERDPNAFSGGAFDRGHDRAFSFAGGKRLGDQADLAAARPAAWINLSLTPDRVDMRV